MGFINHQAPQPEFFAYSIITLYFIFSLTWGFDAYFHNRYLNHPEAKGELLTHQLILIPSILMEIFLILMFWFPLEALPFFLACYLTRTIQEFIDEFKWHTNRCTLTESILHLIMWISVHAKTFITFIWGFFYGYQGVQEFSLLTYLLFVTAVVSTGLISIYDLRLRKS